VSRCARIASTGADGQRRSAIVGPEWIWVLVVVVVVVAVVMAVLRAARRR
jgi:hypothetical protein